MRRLVGGVALVAVLAFAAGCSKKQPSGQATLPPVTVTTPATPTAGPLPTAAACIGTVSGGEDPAKATLKAWLCGDTATLNAKMTSEALSQLNAVPKDIDQTWSYIFCQGGAGSSYCNYRNKVGSELIFKSQNEPPNKITGVQFDRTVYHTDAKLYTKAFVDAWIEGNVQRMQALGTAGVVSFAASHSAPTRPYDITLSPSEVWIFKVTSGGADYRFTVQGTLGKPNAITELIAA